MAESDVGASEELDRAFGAAVGRFGPLLLSALDALELAFRRLHPPDFGVLRDRLAPVREELDRGLEGFARVETPPSLPSFQRDLLEVGGLTAAALAGLVDPGRPEEGASRALRAMHQYARAQALLYPLRTVLPPVSAFFAEAFRRADPNAFEAAIGNDDVGLFRSGDPAARGGFDLYVPETHDGGGALPLVVALHGGSGNGADFLWSWLREARSRDFVLIAPTSRGSTWSLNAPEVDGRALREMVEWVATRWRIDREHVLLTGLSDGATMTLLLGLGEDEPYTHLAPVSGVLHPLNFAIGNLDRARARPIYLVHGALDWMFPVSIAQEAARVLEDAGAEIVYREIEDLSHTYPREENARIIEWFDPSRAASQLASQASRE